MDTIAIIALVGMLVASGFGIFAVFYWLHLTGRWLAEGSKDITATKTDTAQITRILIRIARKIGVSESEIKRVTKK